MTAILPTAMPTANPQVKIVHRPTISWEDFQHKYLNREDRFKYEWVHGQVEKTLRSMDQYQLLISLKIRHLLQILQKNNPDLGEFTEETDSFFKGNHRRPDISYFSKKQIEQILLGNQTPQFVIEIISNNDQMNRANDKLRNYREAEVPVVWQIFPKSKEVHIYKGKQMTICLGDDICSAEPVIPGFVLPAKDLFPA